MNEIVTRVGLKRMEERLNERLESRLLQFEQRMIIELGGLMVVALGTVATLVKIL